MIAGGFLDDAIDVPIDLKCLHHADAVEDSGFDDAFFDPIAFAHFDDFVVFRAVFVVGVKAAENGGEVGVVESIEESEILFDFDLALVHDGLRVGHGEVFDVREKGIVFLGVGVLKEALHVAVGGEEALAGGKDGAVLVFGFHELEHGGVFALHDGLGGHVAGDAFGVADHGEEVPGGERIVGGVADADFFGRRKGLVMVRRNLFPCSVLGLQWMPLSPRTGSCLP